MVESCSAVNCINRRSKGIKMKFHRFPRDPNVRKLWIHALRRENFSPSNTAVICEKHFKNDDYETNVHGNVVLKKGAIPSNFDFASHLKPHITKRRVLKRKYETVVSNIVTEEHPQEYCAEYESEDNRPGQSSCEQINPDLPTLSDNMITQNNVKRTRRKPVSFGDFEESDMNNTKQSKRFWKIANETVSKYRKVNKYYQCEIRRQKQKIQTLNDLLVELISKHKISSTQLLVLKTHYQRPKLREDAIPSIFPDLPEFITKMTKKRRKVDIEQLLEEKRKMKNDAVNPEIECVEVKQEPIDSEIAIKHELLDRDAHEMMLNNEIFIKEEHIKEEIMNDEDFEHS